MTEFATAAYVINHYLYGQGTTPADLDSDTLIRAPGTTSTMAVTMDSYMASVGRFALASEFELIRDFFTWSSVPVKNDAQGNPTFYTKAELATLFDLGSFYGLTVAQDRVADGANDYAERTLIWNSTAFKISDDAQFWVEADGTRHVTGLAIQPLGPENFDFESSSLPTELANMLLEPRTDPFEIGRKVVINFTGDVARRDYTTADYLQDVQTSGTWQAVDPITEYNSVMGLIDQLNQQNIVSPLDAVGRPIVYGSNSPETVQDTTDKSHYYGSKSASGVALIAGAGDDTLKGVAGGSDLLDGGDGIDAADYSGSATPITITLGGSKPIGVGDGAGGLDELRLIETVKGTGGDLLKIVGPVSDDLTIQGVQGRSDNKIDASSYAGDDGIYVTLDAEGNGYLNFQSSGNSQITLEAFGADVIGSGSDDDIINHSIAGSHLSGGAGSDYVEGGGGADTIEGGSNDANDGGADTLVGGAGADAIRGGDGDVARDVDAGDRIAFGPQLGNGEREVASDEAATNPSGTYHGANGITYLYDASAGTLVVNGPSGSMTLTGYQNGEAGITLKTKRKHNDQPGDPTGPAYSPTSYGPPGPATNDRPQKTERGGKVTYVHDYVDPLVLDLNGDGVKLLSTGEKTIYFDSTGDGVAQRTGWVSAQDGLLARDLNGDGVINNNSELFGDSKTEGFAALRPFDGNADGWITTGDAVWNTLRVWVDANSNGVTDAGELKTLGALGINGINLYSEPRSSTIGGNQVVQEGTFRTTDGSTHQLLSVDFGVVNADTNIPTATNVDDNLYKLPNVDGLGALPDLRTAMAGNANLATDVESLVRDARTLTGNGFRERLEQVLLEWAGVASVASDAFGSLVDGRHMAFIQKVENTQLVDYTNGGGQSHIITHDSTAASLEGQYRDLVDYFALRIGIQIPKSESLLGIDTSAITNGPFSPLASLDYDPAVGKVSGSIEDVAFQIAKQLPTDVNQALAYLDRIMPLLQATASLQHAGGDFGWTSDQLGRVVRQGFSEAGVTNAALIEFAVGRTVADSSKWEGTAGDDVIDLQNVLVSRADVIDAGKGNDNITLSLLGDSYLYRLGDGDDVVSATGYRYINVADHLEFADLNREDVTISQSGQSVVFTVNKPEGGSITVNGMLDGYAFNEIDFADGTRLTGEQVVAALSSTAATPGDDFLHGTAFDDRITPGKGDDWILSLGRGNDTVVYTAGDGNDLLDLTGPNAISLELHGITTSQLTFVSLTDGTIKIAFTGPDGGSLTLPQGIESVGQIKFDDGTTWNQAQVKQTAIAMETTAGDDLIYGSAGGDAFASSAGNDTIVGGGSGDLFLFKSGDGMDLIDSRSTDNSVGGRISFVDLNPEQVHFERSGPTGTDLTIVDDTKPNSSITVQNAFSSPSGWTHYSTITDLHFANGHTISFESALATALAFAATSGADNISGSPSDDLIDGLAGNDTIAGGSGSNTLLGSEGDDYLTGGYYTDTLIGGPGDDHIDAGSLFSLNATDTVVFNKGDGDDVIDYAAAATLQLKGFTRSELVFTRLNGDDYTISTVNPADGSIQVNNGLNAGVLYGQFETFRKIVLDDGTILTPSDVAKFVLDHEGTPGDDELTDFQGFDGTLTGGAGNDTLSGNQGSDTYVYNAGDGDDVVQELGWTEIDAIRFLGINPSDVSVSRNGDDAVLTIGGAHPGSIRITGQFAPQSSVNYAGVVERLTFDDGTVWTEANLAEQIASFVGVPTISGTSDADTLAGTADSDIMGGDAGDDVLQGGGGSDKYLWNPGSGNDTITDNGAGDTLEADALFMGVASTDVEGTRAGRDVVLKVKSTGETVTLKDQFDPDDGSGWPSPYTSSETGLEFVTFSDGVTWSAADIARNAWLRASPSQSLVKGTSNDEHFITSGAASWSFSLKGHDTADYTVGSGSLQIYASRDSNDPVEHGGTPVFQDNVNIRIHGVTFDGLSFSVQDSFADGGVSQPFANTNADFSIRFNGSDGLILLKYYLSPRTNPLDYTHDYITLDDGSVHAISDLLASTAIVGTDQADTFSVGTFGSGIVRAGKGDDQVYYAATGNTVEWNRGDGNDTFFNTEGAVLKLIGVDKADAILSQSGSDLVVTVGSEHLTVKDAFVGSHYSFYDNSLTSGGMDFLFADGTIDRATLASQFNYVAEAPTTTGTYYGHDFGETVVAPNGPGSLLLYGGNDVVHAENNGSYVVAGDGDDLVYAPGYVVGGDGNDTIVGASQADGGDGDDRLAARAAGSQLFGGNGNDSLIGGAGSDFMMAGSGDDTMVAGSGSSFMQGQGGSDIYKWSMGSGSIQILEDGSRLDGYDKLVLDGVNRSDVTFQLLGPNLMLNVGTTGKTIFLISQLSAALDPTQPALGVEEIEFADGTLDPSALISNGLFASDDQSVVQAGQSISISMSDLIVNDYVASFRRLPDLAITSVASQDGAVTLHDGYVVFNPTVASGIASFSYTVSEGDATSTATVRVKIDSAAPSNFRDSDDQANSVQDQAFGSTYTGVRLVADDADGDFMSYSLTDNAAGRFFIGSDGAVYVNGSGSIDVADGSYQITARVSDGLLTADRTFTIGITGFNAIAGTSGNDALIGTAGDDSISGGAGYDTLSGGGGDDRLIGGSGDDVIDGGAGYDVAVISGSAWDYQVYSQNGTITVIDQNPADGDLGTDTLTGVEELRADNASWNTASPIVLDLDGNGVQLTEQRNSGAAFDWNGDGVLDQTGWVGPGDGVLYYDRNSDNTVNNAAELSFTNDKVGAKSDLDGLGGLDSNRDGTLSSADDAWAKMGVWVDMDADGAVDAGELRTLGQLGISSIDLASTALSGAVNWGDNIRLNNGTFHFANGNAGALDDVAFSYTRGKPQPAASTNIQQFAQASATFNVASSSEIKISDLGASNENEPNLVVSRFA